MRYTALLLLTAQSLMCADLASLLPSAKTNLQIESVRLEAQKTKEQLEQAKTAYYPTLNATALYQRKDKATAFEPKTIHGLELGTQVNIFDGFRRESTLDAIHSAIDSAEHSLAQKEQDVLLDTITAYYTYFNAKAELDAISDKKTELSAQVERFSILVKNDLATDDILKSLIASKLQSEYDEQNQKIILERSRKNLELLTGQSVQTLEYRELSVPTTTQIERNDLKADQSSIETLSHTEGLYTYLPTLTIAAKHRTFDYNDYDTMNGANIQPENQNEIIASLSMTLFDMGSIAKEREQARLSTLKAQKLIEYKTKSIRNEADIALMSLDASQNAYKAARAEEESRNVAFVYIKKRFEAGLVNSTNYLSELSDLSASRARAQNARNALQIAKANLAYAYGTDLMSLLKEKK